MAKQCQHLFTEEWKRLITILCKCDYLLYGMLGTWNITSVYLELRDDAKPLCIKVVLCTSLDGLSRLMGDPERNPDGE